jgi:hypothetical protein
MLGTLALSSRVTATVFVGSLAVTGVIAANAAPAVKRARVGRCERVVGSWMVVVMKVKWTPKSRQRFKL